MDLSTFIVSAFCLIDDRLKGRRVRQCGPSPKLCDAEILTIEIVGESLDTDKAPHRYFRKHYGGWLPALGEVHRTTLPGRQPTSGRSRNASGKIFSPSLPTTPPSLSSTRCPC